MNRIKEIYKGTKNDSVTILKHGNFNIVGIIRVRNEELIIKDTLDYMSTICDGIVLYDDCSEDETYNITMEHDSVIAVVKNEIWEGAPSERNIAETYQRQVILDLAQRYSPKWIYYADGDERCIGNIKQFLNSKEAEKVDGIRVCLYDAYMTEDDCKPIVLGDKLLNFRDNFGPERRDIIMFWKNNKNIKVNHRVPSLSDTKHNIITKFECQHYGKSLSIDHWEATCDYYIHHRSINNIRGKWTNRKGKAIHTESDFNRPLYKWSTELFSNSVKIG
jgi:hypothetical protein